MLGDGTGVGKGRTIAAIMSEMMGSEKVERAAWVSAAGSLFAEAKRDAEAVAGEGEPAFRWEGEEEGKGGKG